MFVFPMVGRSNRFRKEGYKVPKYQLEISNRSVLELVLTGFNKYFKTDEFLFILNAEDQAEPFVRAATSALGMRQAKIVTLHKMTSGQAETVYEALVQMEDNELASDLYIFNIDTLHRRYRKPGFVSDGVDGYLETFIGSGPNWSNVVPCDSDTGLVMETGEKKELSEYCCTGLYYWKNAQLYCDIFERYEPKNFGCVESYIAPMYNLLIGDGGIVRQDVVSMNDIKFCGVPIEYQELKKEVNLNAWF